MSHEQFIADKAALEFYVDSGVDVAIADAPIDRFKVIEPPPTLIQSASAPPSQTSTPASIPLGKSEAALQTTALAKAANSLDELRDAIANFDGIALKKTATNLVFSDGHPKADVMLIGEAPGADEDRQGKPFVGVSGQLLDKMLGCIGLDRSSEDPEKAFYISNIINWRPPGNRTPSDGEIEVSLPFIERHIQLVKPKLIILCGGVSAKALLGSNESVSKIRRAGWHDYLPQTDILKDGASPIPAIATYHPAYLLRTPAQKRASWADMLKIQSKLLSLKEI